MLVVAATLFAVTSEQSEDAVAWIRRRGRAHADGRRGRDRRRGRAPRARFTARCCRGSRRCRECSTRSFATIPPLSSNEDRKADLHPGRDVRVSRRRRVAGEYGGTGLLRDLRRAHPERTRHHRVGSPVSTAGRRRQREHGAILLPRQRSGRPAHGRGPGPHRRADRDCRRRRRCSLQGPADRRHLGSSTCRRSSARPRKRSSSPSARGRSGDLGTRRQTRDPGHRPGDADDRRQDARRAA